MCVAQGEHSDLFYLFMCIECVMHNIYPFPICSYFKYIICNCSRSEKTTFIETRKHGVGDNSNCAFTYLIFYLKISFQNIYAPAATFDTKLDGQVIQGRRIVFFNLYYIILESSLGDPQTMLNK